LRQDYWLFLGAFLGMGTLMEREERSHGAIELAVSFNKPMKVCVEGECRECSLLAIGSRVPHTIDGGEGWQFFGFLHPESRLARLIQNKIDASGRTWLYEETSSQRAEPIDPSLDLIPSTYRVRELWEFLLSHFLGIHSYSLGWNKDLRKIWEVIESLPGKELSLKRVSDSLEMKAFELEESFFRLVGIPFSHFIINRKLVYVSEEIKKGISLDAAVSAAGLSGLASLTSYTYDLYGMNMDELLTEKPYVRFFSAADYEQLSGHAV
jgi:hypothetical protein